MNLNPHVRAYLDAAREYLIAKHDEGLSARQLNEEHAEMMDRLVRKLFRLAGDPYLTVDPKLGTRLAVVAVGGYGRRELSLGSDVDLLFLYRSKLSAYVETVAETVMQRLWDATLDVGHALRSVAESMRMGRDDLTILTSYLDARLLIGDPGLFAEFDRETSRLHTQALVRVRRREARRAGQAPRAQGRVSVSFAARPQRRRGRAARLPHGVVAGSGAVLGRPNAPNTSQRHGLIRRRRVERAAPGARFPVAAAEPAPAQRDQETQGSPPQLRSSAGPGEVHGPGRHVGTARRGAAHARVLSARPLRAAREPELRESDHGAHGSPPRTPLESLVSGGRGVRDRRRAAGDPASRDAGRAAASLAVGVRDRAAPRRGALAARAAQRAPASPSDRRCVPLRPPRRPAF